MSKNFRNDLPNVKGAPQFFSPKRSEFTPFASLKASSLGEVNLAQGAIESRARIPGLFIMKVADGYLKVGFYFFKGGRAYLILLLFRNASGY
jgi:hypothetical protein